MFNNKISWILKLFRLQWRLDKMWIRLIGSEKTEYVWNRIPFYKQMWQDAARELSLQFVELAEGIWQVGFGNRQTIVDIHKVQLDDFVISSISSNKPFVYKLMETKGLPVPTYMTFRLDELGKAERFVKQNKGPFVIKPAIGTSAGMGVTTHIKSYLSVIKAIALASLYGDEIIIERLVIGECYRLLILDGKMIHAVRRRGLWLTGDGESTLLQLIQRENKRRLTTERTDTIKPITRDRDFEATLHAQGLSCESIINSGRQVLVKSFDSPFLKDPEVRTVYNDNVTNLLSQDIRNKAESAAVTLNATFAGVDIITPNPTVSLEEGGGVINEINTNPGLHHHYNLINDGGPPPAMYVLRYLLGLHPL